MPDPRSRMEAAAKAGDVDGFIEAAESLLDWARSLLGSRYEYHFPALSALIGEGIDEIMDHQRGKPWRPSRG